MSYAPEKFSKIYKAFLFQPIFPNFFKPCVNFSRVWTKNRNCWEAFEKILTIFDENAIGYSLGQVVAKIRASGNNIIFLQPFFQFLGRGTFPMLFLKNLH